MNAYSDVWKSITGIPTNDLSAKRYTFVAYDSSNPGQVITPTTAGQACVGVLYEPNGAGQPAQVVKEGFAYITLGATLTPGQVVMTDTSGNAVAYTAATDPAFNVPLGTIAVGGASGAIGTVLLNC